MRTTSSTFGALLIGCLCVGASLARGAEYDQRVHPTAYAYNMFEETAEVDAAADACAPCDPCATCVPCDACYSDPCEPYKLFPCGLWGLNVDMWLETGGYSNAYGERTTPEWSTVQNNDGWVLNQLWLSLGKEADNGGCGVAFGGQMDFLFGTDALLTQGFGAEGTWDTTWEADGAEYGWAMPQLYAEVALNNWTVKGGHFYTVMGYDVVQAPQNFFYSHGYNWYFGEPFTHTGVLAEYNGFENLSFSTGWTAGWDTGFANPDNSNLILGSVSLAVTDYLSVGYAINAGNWGDGVGDLYMHTILMQLDLTDNLHWVLQNDLGTNYNRGVGNADTNWGGINNIVTYDINDCWGIGNRVEWFDDTDGVRTGLAGDYWNYTVGLNYKPWANVMIRPELRYDWYTGQGAPFNGGMNKDQFGGGCDIVVTW